MNTRIARLWTALILSCSAIAAADQSEELPCNNSNPTGQGWSEDCRQWIYHANQGSRLIQKQWLAALEQKESQNPFLSAVTEKYQYLPGKRDQKHNPDGLPIGFTVDREERHCDDTEQKCEPVDWVGITCAACHTGEIRYNGKPLLIDGGPTMADFVGFLRGLLDALQATFDDRGQGGKFARFANRVLGAKASDEKVKEVLSHDLEKFITGLKVLPAVVQQDFNSAHYDAGYGRGDAFGLLIDQIVYRVMGRKPASAYATRFPPLNAPVSMPFLWYTPTLRWVQWNGSVGSPFVRNFGQAMGAFGLVSPGDEFKHIRLDITREGLVRKKEQCEQYTLPKQKVECEEEAVREREAFREQHAFRTNPTSVEKWKPLKELLENSHIKVETIQGIESVVAWLTPPEWPDIFEKIDRTKWGAGQKVYKEHCIGCHAIPKTENSVNNHHEAIEVTLLLDTEVGTDAMMTRNFVCNKVRPDPTKDVEADDLDDTHKTAALAARAIANSPVCEKYPGQGPPASAIFQGVVDKASLLQKQRDPQFKMDSRKFGSPQLPQCPLCYKAGPLRGIWATAPYLHNGSVPNLKQLLLPETCNSKQEQGEVCRMKTFCVGSREFDQKNLGFDLGDGTQCEGAFKFDTEKTGNRNTGHLYGTELPLADREALLEFLKDVKDGAPMQYSKQ